MLWISSSGTATGAVSGVPACSAWRAALTA
jgi:hypothetical protein